MRKALIAVVVASALFAVGAFAANFAVNSEDVASGADSVTACAAEVDVDFVTVYDNQSPGDWDVGSVVLTFYSDSDGTVTQACGGFGANVAVMTDSTTPAATGTATVGATSSTVTVPLSPALKAGDITSAAVLVDGQALQTATPGQG